MVSNSSRILLSDNRKDEASNFALMTYFLTPTLDVNLKTFKTIVHLYFISLCNSFGIADDQLLRIGTGLYFPSVTFDFLIKKI
jgi:hypothetical protein